MERLTSGWQATLGTISPGIPPLVTVYRHFSYVWEHLDVGYVQGMCDLLAPLLVILDNGEGPSLGVGERAVERIPTVLLGLG